MALNVYALLGVVCCFLLLGWWSFHYIDTHHGGFNTWRK